MASGVYWTGIAALVNGDVAWDTSDIRAQLTANTYTPNFVVHDYLNDVSGSKMSGTTDADLTMTAATVDTAEPAVECDNAEAGGTTTWSSVASGTTSGCVIYNNTGTASTSVLLCWNEFTTAKAANGSDIEVTWAAEGHIKFT